MWRPAGRSWRRPRAKATKCFSARLTTPLLTIVVSVDSATRVAVQLAPSAPACTACGSGTFSSGYIAGGQPCKDCPQAANFTGKMVSPAGIFTPEDCYGEFTTDGEPTPTIMQNNLAWDYIPHSPGMLQLKSGATTPLACQADCSSSAVCQARIVRRHTLGRAMIQSGPCPGYATFLSSLNRAHSLTDPLAPPPPSPPSPQPLLCGGLG